MPLGEGRRRASVSIRACARSWAGAWEARGPEPGCRRHGRTGRSNGDTWIRASIAPSRRRPGAHVISGGRSTRPDQGGRRRRRGPNPMDTGVVRSLRIRLLLPLAVVTVVVTVGTLGYFWLWHAEGGTWMDALFMTVTTITTIGYGEVKPLGTTGRIFTMVLGHRGDRQPVLHPRRGDGVPGRGQAGRSRQGGARWSVASRPCGSTSSWPGSGESAGRPPRSSLRRPCRSSSWIRVRRRRATPRSAATCYRRATPPTTTILERAGVRRASGLVVTTATDATNMYIILSARVLNPDLSIVSRAVDEASVTKLIRAGRQPGDQPLCHRRSPTGPPDPEADGRGLLRDGATDGRGRAQHRGPGGDAGQPDRRPDARRARHPPRHRRDHPRHPARGQRRW